MLGCGGAEGMAGRWARSPVNPLMWKRCRSHVRVSNHLIEGDDQDRYVTRQLLDAPRAERRRAATIRRHEDGRRTIGMGQGLCVRQRRLVACEQCACMSESRGGTTSQECGGMKLPAARADAAPDF